MSGKRIFGLICLILGIGMLFYAHYGNERMAQARKEIADTKIDRGLIPENPVIDPLKKEVEGSIKQKYYRKVDAYEPLIKFLSIGGWVLVASGVVLLVFGGRKKTQ